MLSCCAVFLLKWWYVYYSHVNCAYCRMSYGLFRVRVVADHKQLIILTQLVSIDGLKMIYGLHLVTQE